MVISNKSELGFFFFTYKVLQFHKRRPIIYQLSLSLGGLLGNRAGCCGGRQHCKQRRLHPACFCELCQAVTPHTPSGNESHFFSLLKNEQLFVGMQKIFDAINLRSFTRDEFSHSINNLVPQFGRLQAVGIIFQSILHQRSACLFHNPDMCSSSCNRFCTCMQENASPRPPLILMHRICYGYLDGSGDVDYELCVVLQKRT